MKSVHSHMSQRTGNRLVASIGVGLVDVSRGLVSRVSVGLVSRVSRVSVGLVGLLILAAACAPKPGETVAPPVAEALSRQESAQAAAALRSGSLPQSIELAREALRIHEQNVEAMLVMAEAYLKQDKHELTQTVTSSALAVDPKLLTPTETSRIHNLKGFAYLAADKQNLATQSFRKAAEVDARNATAWNNLGAQYLRTGNFKTAGDCFTYATKLDPAFYKAHLNLGSARRALGDVVNAERSYQTALKLRPEYREAYFSLGVLYLDASEFPGTDTATRLTRALNNFSKYRELAIASGTGRSARRSARNAPRSAARMARPSPASRAPASPASPPPRSRRPSPANPACRARPNPGHPRASPAKPRHPPASPAPRPRHPPASQANRARHPS